MADICYIRIGAEGLQGVDRETLVIPNQQVVDSCYIRIGAEGLEGVDGQVLKSSHFRGLAAWRGGEGENKSGVVLGLHD